MQTSNEIKLLLSLNILATTFHLYHNVRYIDTVYFESATLRLPLIVGWVFSTAFGLIGLRKYTQGNQFISYIIFTIYSLLCTASFIHYTSHSFYSFTFIANTGILLEILFALIFAIYS